MNKRRNIVLWLLFFCLVIALIPATLSALGRRARSEAEETVQVTGIEETVNVTGVVRLVGSSPLPELVITTPDREWYVSKEEEYKLKELQHQTVTVEAVETVRTLRFANGLPAGERYSLDKIRVITVH